MDILVASNNAHKLQELREIFALNDLAVNLLSPAQLGISLEPVEDAPDYLGNAQIKARQFFAASGARGLPVLADDSGLEVHAMGGRPGVLSARYFKAAPGGNGWAAVLAELRNTSVDARLARFVAVLVFVSANGSERAFEGICDGAIAFGARGDGGFGYDPVFVPRNGDARNPGHWLNQPTIAELAAPVKNRISHRGLAGAALCRWLKATA
jgi:XTP/dITP diphosphohydrolase